jgi:hypothetical protein
MDYSFVGLVDDLAGVAEYTARSKSRQIIRVVLSTYSAEPRNNWLGRIEKAFESRGREVDLSPKDHQVAFVVNNRPAAVDGNTAHDAHT